MTKEKDRFAGVSDRPFIRTSKLLNMEYVFDPPLQLDLTMWVRVHQTPHDFLIFICLSSYVCLYVCFFTITNRNNPTSFRNLTHNLGGPPNT